MEKKMFSEHTQEIQDLINGWVDYAPIHNRWVSKLIKKPFSIRPYNQCENESDSNFDKRVSRELNKGYNILVATHAPYNDLDVSSVEIFNPDFTDNTFMYEDLERDNHMIIEDKKKKDWGYFYFPYGYVIETDQETLNKIDRKSKNRVRVKYGTKNIL